MTQRLVIVHPCGAREEFDVEFSHVIRDGPYRVLKTKRTDGPPNTIYLGTGATVAIAERMP